MLNVKGFSLIELMVVIAIVAVLSAIAVPAYKNYIIRAKTTEIVKVIDNLAQKSIEYSATHGAFPNAYDLGLSTTPGQSWVDNPSEFLPASYFLGPDALINFYDTSVDNGFPACGASALVNVNVDAYALGIPGANAPGDGTMFISYRIYNLGGVLKPLKYFGTVIYSSGWFPDEYISGWSNWSSAFNVGNQQLYDEISNNSVSVVCQ